MPDDESVTIVVFSGELDRALAAFNIANTAASMGMKVTMFFTFWGLSIIQKAGNPRKDKSTPQWMMGMMHAGGTKRRKLSQMNMMGAGKKMMQSLMKKYRMPTLAEQIELALEQDVNMVACTTSMALMGLQESDFIEGVGDFVGAATYLGLASEGKINLFI